MDLCTGSQRGRHGGYLNAAVPNSVDCLAVAQEYLCIRQSKPISDADWAQRFRCRAVEEAYRRQCVLSGHAQRVQRSSRVCSQSVSTVRRLGKFCLVKFNHIGAHTRRVLKKDFWSMNYVE